MAKGRPKPSDYPDDDEEDFPVSIQVGDLSVTTKKSNLEACSEVTIKLLKDKTIKNYLGIYKYKKLISPTGIG